VVYKAFRGSCIALCNLKKNSKQRAYLIDQSTQMYITLRYMRLTAEVALLKISQAGIRDSRERPCQFEADVTAKFVRCATNLGSNYILIGANREEMKAYLRGPMYQI